MYGYKEYRNNIIATLSNEIRKNGKEIANGVWRGEQQDSFRHILPLPNGENTKRNRIAAIKEYLGIKIDEKFLSKPRALHQFAHHLNSSQLLCYMTFRPLLTDEYRPTEELINLLNSVGIYISENAKCEFEYNDNLTWDNKPEGTSFDFHIYDSNKQYFFEIKFTEDGFGDAKKDDSHIKKFDDLYRDKIKDVLNQEVTVDECLKYYQLFRNIIRCDSDSNTIVLITDEENPVTSEELSYFEKNYLNNTNINIIPLTWQVLCKKWPKNIQKPFQFICFESEFSI
ncbi:MAG: hypothetical protein HDS83_04675 [Bacteroidales bacterium]|nr:hypothetical protein [Bacteroidales bacterium]